MLTTNIEIIRELTKRNLYEYQTLSDLFDMLKVCEKKHFDFVHKLNKSVRSIASRQTANSEIEIAERVKFEKLYKRSLLFDAQYDFEAFMLYVEWDRNPKKRFYQPRRRVLRVVVQDMQDLHDGKLDFLSVSLPVRTGKTTLGIFFMVWLMLKYPDKPNLMTGHSDKLTKGMHQEILSILRDPQYLVHDVFPDRKIVKVSNEDETVDIDAERRFSTLTCRSILGTLTGAVDIKGLLYADDLIEDLEESLNPNRLDAKYDAYLNQIKDRKGDGVPELHIGTRWNVNDPIGRIYRDHKDDPRYRFRVIPALDENDESNFIYDYPEIGFSTKHYHDMRQEFENRGDMPTWYAKFQGEPRVREGLVFNPDGMRYFNGNLPEGNCEVYSFCDPAWGGSDALSMPFGYKYDDDHIYVPDIIYDKRDKDVTEPRVCAKIIEHKPNVTEFESNNGGELYKEHIEESLISKGHRFNIITTLTTGGRFAKGAKHSQILAYAPDIRSKLIFVDPKKQSPEYRRAFDELTSYTEDGNVKHDDVPDSLAKMMRRILDGTTTYEICDRSW